MKRTKKARPKPLTRLEFEDFLHKGIQRGEIERDRLGEDPIGTLAAGWIMNLMDDHADHAFTFGGLVAVTNLTPELVVEGLVWLINDRVMDVGVTEVENREIFYLDVQQRQLRHVFRGKNESKDQYGEYVAQVLRRLNPNLPHIVRRSLVRIEHSEGVLGSGFLIGENLILTCAHCLPRLPDPQMQGDDWVLVKVRTLDGSISAEAAIAFADPVADLAILCQPDNQELPDRAAEFDRLVNSLLPLRLPDVPPASHTDHPCFLLTCDDQWLGRPTHFGKGRGGTLTMRFDDQIARVPGGTSGSPVVDDNGAVLGVLKIGSLNNAEAYAVSIPAHLPQWAVEMITTAQSRREGDGRDQHG